MENRYSVRWDEDELCYIGECSIIADIRWLSDTPEGALKGVKRKVERVELMMKEDKYRLKPDFDGGYIIQKLGWRGNWSFVDLARTESEGREAVKNLKRKIIEL